MLPAPPPAPDVKSVQIDPSTVAQVSSGSPAAKAVGKAAVAAPRPTMGGVKTAGAAATSSTRTEAPDTGSGASAQATVVLVSPGNAASTADGASSGHDPGAMAAAAAAALAANAPTAANSSAAPPAAGLGVEGVTAADGATSVASALAAAHAAVSTLPKDDVALLAADKDKVAGAIADAAAPQGGDSAAGLAQLTSNAPVNGSSDPSPTPTVRVHASVDSPEFAQGLSDRVSWMVGNGLNGAKLQVNPPALGPIELRIAVTAGHAQVWMITHSAVTRDALESSSPQLRDMLSAQGFGQVSVDISQRSFQDRSTYSQPYEHTTERYATVAPTAASAVGSTALSSALGGLDAYA